jgi:DNA invertase Pin-like site-specific DNA recombinase
LPVSPRTAPGKLHSQRPMSPTPIEESRAELAALRNRLSKHQAEGTAIDRALAAAVERARAARLSMLEIATDMGIARSTLYIAIQRGKADPPTAAEAAAKRPEQPKE